MKYHYTKCGTIACPCCDQTFTTIRKFHPHFMKNHKGQVSVTMIIYCIMMTSPRCHRTEVMMMSLTREQQLIIGKYVSLIYCLYILVIFVVYAMSLLWLLMTSFLLPMMRYWQPEGRDTSMYGYCSIFTFWKINLCSVTFLNQTCAYGHSLGYNLTKNVCIYQHIYVFPYTPM